MFLRKQLERFRQLADESSSEVPEKDLGSWARKNDELLSDEFIDDLVGLSLGNKDE